MIFDEKNGIAFIGYNADLIRAFLILVHYTDLDTSEYDTGEGRHNLYDIIATHDMWDDLLGIVEADMADVDNICMRLESSARRSFEHAHSLQFQVLKTLQSILGAEDVTETIAKADALNSKLIDMLGALQTQQCAHVEARSMRLAKKKEL